MSSLRARYHYDVALFSLQTLLRRPPSLWFARGTAGSRGGPGAGGRGPGGGGGYHGGGGRERESIYAVLGSRAPTPH